jgi:hypothetical protein
MLQQRTPGFGRFCLLRRVRVRNEPLGPDPRPRCYGKRRSHAGCRAENQRTGRSSCRGPARDLNVTGAADAEAAITAVVARGQSLVIDMSALDFIDCSTLGALLRVRGLLRARGLP